MKNLLKKAYGFTLVELIAVVSVIVILVAIVVPRIGDLRSNATSAKVSSNVRVVQSALEQAQVAGVITTASTPTEIKAALIIATTVNGQSWGPFLAEWPADVDVAANAAGTGFTATAAP